MEHTLRTAFPIAFPIFFVGMWLLVSTLIGAKSGWYELARRYPDRPEPALAKLGFQSGVMGPTGIGINGILTVSACRSGLRVEIWQVFGPFSKPFLVPWNEISVRPRQIFFHPYARLGFGNPEVGVLSIGRDVWGHLAGRASATAGSTVAEALPPLPKGRMLRAYLLQWLAVTAFGAAFFFLAPRLMSPAGPHPSLIVCFALPAIVFGIGTLIRYAAQQPPP
ncbi:MAG TPA: hypothetical protein VGH03_04275 [Caulobacteraceae bacterium]